MSKIILPNIPYFSQTDNSHTDGKYWASDPDRRDLTPDGCWMNELPGGGHYGREARGCPGPKQKGCIRPGSCNVTSLYMLASYFGLIVKPQHYPDGSSISSFLQRQPLSPTWLYVYMMDYWGKGRQIWDGIKPTSAHNSLICARGDTMREMLRQLIQATDSNLQPVYTTGVTFAKYRSALESGSPVVISSRRMHHVILGVGAFDKGGKPWIVAHDPYGRKKADLSRWEAYNGCGDRAEYGRAVEYPFDLLEAQSLLYCRESHRWVG